MNAVSRMMSQMLTPLVGVVMGSSSRLGHDAARGRDAQGIRRRRTRRGWSRRTACPTRCSPMPRRPRARGLRAIIAGAGGAAHLPGMLAAKTIVPVLGVPVPSKHLRGEDSLLSHRADAQGHSGRDLRHRRGRRGQRGAVRGRHARRDRRRPGARSWRRSARARPQAALAMTLPA